MGCPRPLSLSRGPMDKPLGPAPGTKLLSTPCPSPSTRGGCECHLAHLCQDACQGTADWQHLPASPSSREGVVVSFRMGVGRGSSVIPKQDMVTRSAGSAGQSVHRVGTKYPFHPHVIQVDNTKLDAVSECVPRSVCQNPNPRGMVLGGGPLGGERSGGWGSMMGLVPL